MRKYNIEANRRRFLKDSFTVGMGLSLISPFQTFIKSEEHSTIKKVGMIGLDTGHSPAFVKSLNTAKNGEFQNYKVVAAYPKGTENIMAWKNRIPEFTAEVEKYGVEIVDSIPALLDKVDYVILTTIDGNKHLEQALPVFEAKLPVFIDKPFAASIEDARKIAKAAEASGTPMFSSSSVRYITGAKEIINGSIGRVKGVDAYSPAHIEEHHPDLFWYGVHGIELLFAIMGTGCQWVQRTYTEDTDVVVGQWADHRIGTFRGIRKGKGGYGCHVFGEKEIKLLNQFGGYGGLLFEIVQFFETKIPPVPIHETLEIFTFMEAAERSKHQNGERIFLDSI